MSSNDIAIKVENISKIYRIGLKQEMHDSFARTVLEFLRSPLKNYRKYRSLYQFDDIESINDSNSGTGSSDIIWALRDVCFEVEQREVVGIIGKNGAGKSTLLKILSRITDPTRGRAEMDGRISSLLEVGTGFHQELTGRENVYLNGTILGLKKKEVDSKYDEIVDFSGVEKFIDTPVKRYSSGMKVRLAFSVAAHLEPEIFLVDEVLAVGDAEFQKKCLRAMDDMRSGGRTVIFISHHMAAVENLCPRVIWLDNGQVRQDGDAREVIKAYLSSFAQVQETGFDLCNMENRGGNGAIRYTRIEFLNSDRQPQKLLRSGDTMIARLHYHAEKHVRNPHFALELFTEFGTKITSFNTWASGFEIPSLPPGDGYIELEVDSLNIVGRRCYISLWVASAGNLWYDRLDHCATLDVEASDFYQSGREMTSQHFGLAIFPCKWELKSP